MAAVPRGFFGRRRRTQDRGDRLPPGQDDVGDSFPVVSAARRNAATRYVGASDRSNRNAIRFSTSTGSMGFEPWATCG